MTVNHVPPAMWVRIPLLSRSLYGEMYIFPFLDIAIALGSVVQRENSRPLTALLVVQLHPESPMNSRIKIQCPHCDRMFMKHGLKTHIWRAHSEGRNFIYNKNRVAMELRPHKRNRRTCAKLWYDVFTTLC